MREQERRKKKEKGMLRGFGIISNQQGEYIMGNEENEPLLHWNYFFALANDLENVSRYIEFSQKNFDTYSIELAHLLLASSSEVDVVCKQICGILSPNTQAETIKDYQDIILTHFPDFPKEKVFYPRYGRSFTPWEKWEFIMNKLI